MDSSFDYYIQEKMSWKNLLNKDVKKNKNFLQPIFEAFTNALEAIEIKAEKHEIKAEKQGKIIIRLYKKNLINIENSFEKFVLEDNGIGFNEEQFIRFQSYRDESKNKQNLGTGRLQLLLFFDTANYKSVFKDENNQFQERNFVLSKKFLNLPKDAHTYYNAIIKKEQVKASEARDSKTILTLSGLLDPKDERLFNAFSIEELKEKILEKYQAYLYLKKDFLPEILLEFYLNGQKQNTLTISAEDVISLDAFEEKIEVFYRDKNTDKKLEKAEEFTILSFKNKQNKNQIFLTSKNELIKNDQTNNLTLSCLGENDKLQDCYHLFLIQGNYLDQHRTNDGKIDLLRKKDKDLFTDFEIIYLDDLEKQVNIGIEKMYPEIKQLQEKRAKEIEQLKKMFLLDEKHLKKIKNRLDLTEEEILKTVYQEEAKESAKTDDKIKKIIDNLNILDVNTIEFTQKIEEFVKEIPLQNRTALTHYVAKRALVLEVFDKILNTEKKEEYFHQFLLPKKQQNQVETSNLWLINEDFIYFDGNSEQELQNIKYNNQKILKDDFTVEEQEHLKSLGENRMKKRPDILLFPEEGKCIIIELKAADTNLSNYLHQIDQYARLIRDYTNDNFDIHTFYGYLIGEKIHFNDLPIQFENAYRFGYAFRPAQKVSRTKGGSLYTEILTYSQLFERAKQRNDIFFKKLDLKIKA